jgi:hypothetical protein
MESDPRRRALREAHEQLAAARAVLGDPQVPPRLAAPHLLRAWQMFEALPSANGDDPVRRALATELPGLAEAAEPDPRALRRHVAALGRALARADGYRPGPPIWPGAAVAVLAVAAVVGYAKVRALPAGDGPWRGEYYPQLDFEGRPSLRRDSAIDFEWRYLPPHPELPPDRFSIRWDTCLELPHDAFAAFQLVSDNGSRLFVDGEEVVDNWETKTLRSRGARLPLAAGRHHLRVEFFDDAKVAEIHLRASLDEESPPEHLPPELLRYPGDDPEGPICGS